MFFGNCDFNIRLVSVHLLTWGHRSVIIPPKKTFALSYREIGDSRFIFDDCEYKAQSGDVLYFPKGSGYRLEAGRERLYGVNFEAEGNIPQCLLQFSVKNRPFFETAFSELYRIWSGREKGYYARATSYFYRIIAELVKEGEEEGCEQAFLKLQPAVSKIYSDYSRTELSVSGLAEYIGVSETYFRRIFIKYMGETPLSFITRVRIDYAAEYLDGGFYNVESVSEMCGFNDAKYFATVFKKIKGVSPSDYIRGARL